MDDFPKRLRKLRGNLSQRKFADLIGVTHQRVSDYEKGKVQPTLEFFELIEKNLKLNLNWLVNGKGEIYFENTANDVVKEPGSKYATGKTRDVPLVGEVECGIPLHSWSGFGKDYVPVADVSHFNTPFLLKAKGESMYPYIRPGDLLLCADEPQRIKDKSIVVVSFKTEPESAEANAKLISYPDKNRVMLYSINSNFKPSFHKLSEIYKIYKVVKIIREVK